jgi:putative Mg2+ transporter-C (MgtC) family protein
MAINEAVVLLALATLLGAGIGFQREWTQRPAGLRTHALVSLGSCAFAEYSALLHDTRIAAGVVTGIGFLGAGAIIRRGLATHGLTTAASVWTASAIGLGLGLGGLGWLTIAVALVVLTIVMLAVPDAAIMRRLPRRMQITIRVHIDVERLSIERVRAELFQLVEHARFNDEISIGVADGTRQATVGFIIRTDVHANLPRIFEELSAVAGVLRVSVAEESGLPG